MQRIQIHPLLWEILTSTLSCISIIHTPSVCAFFQRVHLLGSWEAWAPTTSSKWLTSKKSISWSRMSNQIVVYPFPIPLDFCKLQGQPQDGKKSCLFHNIQVRIVTARSNIFHIFIFDLTVPGATVQRNFSQMFAERCLAMTMLYVRSFLYSWHINP